MTVTKIDWLNHGIAFISSVVGIFIAFQLSDWQERRSKEEELELTLKAIKLEVEGNLAIYKTNDTTFTIFLDYIDFIHSHSANNELQCTESELADMKKKNPNRFNDVKLIGTMSDGRNRYDVPMKIDALPATGISTVNWDAAKASGILNYMDHGRMVLLAQMYEWTTKRLGVTDEDLINNFLTPDDFDELDKALRDYRVIKKVASMKYGRIKQYYDQMKW